ncbi:prestalk protein-like [Mercenaria mercenaria]|uniref:prestalk protein-like n=1 Tax=Mercenaria mercenaria TaxID=6596 RepID=UPI00234E831E|nr:prestalk protein-like [Mercenaria mercenaria]
MIVVKLFVLGYIGLFYFAQAERCFHCTDVADPSNCTKIETCGPDQTCSIRQFVTAVGDVMYSSGCLDKTKCGTLGNILGKRDISERGTDVTTCYECCDQDFCNNQGCGTTAISRDKRGPYCFTCDASLDPQACTDINICKETEECIVFVSTDLSSSSQVVYTSMCESNAACTAFSHIGISGSCPPVCCNQDFCNDKCSLGVMTTSPPVVCDTSAGYQLLQDGNTSLCVHTYTNHEDWYNARATCIAAGGDLVILDTNDKAVLMRNTILNDIHHNHQEGYWIGARDFDLNDTFLWINSQKVDTSEADWHPGQPNHHDGGHDQNCAVMWRGSHSHSENYQWHDDFCDKPLGFICEQS